VLGTALALGAAGLGCDGTPRAIDASTTPSARTSAVAVRLDATNDKQPTLSANWSCVRANEHRAKPKGSTAAVPLVERHRAPNVAVRKPLLMPKKATLSCAICTALNCPQKLRQKPTHLPGLMQKPPNYPS